MPLEADSRGSGRPFRLAEAGSVTFLATLAGADDAQVCGILKPRSADCDAFVGVVGACLGRE